MAGRIEGKRTLVTGAANGIGLATARRFAAEGASVALLDVEGEAVQAAAQAIAADGGTALPLVADVTDEPAVQARRSRPRWSGSAASTWSSPTPASSRPTTTASTGWSWR